MADNIKYRFIQNVGDFFPSGYFGEDFIDRVQKISGYTNDQVTDVCSKYVQFRRKYDEYKNRMVTQALRPKDSIRYTHEFHTDLLKILGYGDLGKPYNEPYILDEERQELIPVRHILRRNDKVQMLVMEMRSLIKVGDEEPAGLFEQQYAEEAETNKPSRFTASHWSDVFTLPDGYKISPAIVNKAISRIFLLPEDRRPSYILMCAGNTIFLFDKEKWNRGSYLSFTLDDLFSQASISAFRKYYALFHMLVCKETLSPQGESILMDVLVEDSYKNAYEVTKDLKEGVVSAVETLANEALWFWQHLPEDSEVYNPLKTIDYTDDTFESEVKDDCLVYIYRLLFLFYAESRTELDILPTGDEVYEHGYSLEMLRDLEQVRLISEESKRGYFFDASLKRLFSLLSSGHKENQPKEELDHSFCVRHIDSPMFDDRKLHHLGQVRFRNEKWQQIICALSLSRKQQGRGRGRISYANLGVNQLGSVYESLLAYRGFYAEEDYIEVHKAGKPEEGTFLVPYSRMDDFDPDEILRDDNGIPVRLEKGTFVYRLNGRDRQKSASYYTPEILTRSTVKYTLKAIIQDVADGKRKALDILDLKILEPAMGAAAFQNEVINQLAEAYLQYRQEEKKKEYIERGTLDEDNLEDGTWRIAPDHYRDELQKVKAYIATHNVYGVDLNPTAIELGKLSLWLNVIHKDMETPFFSNRLALGNAVIGAWLKVYDKEEVIAIQDKTYSKKVKWIPTPWWEKEPHKIRFYNNKKRINRSVNEVYHFLLPDKAMLAVRNIAEQRKDHPEETTKMNTLIKDWTAAITEIDFRILQRLSKKIDLRLREYFEFQRDIDRLTENKMAVWGVPGNYQMETFKAEKYAEKEKMFDTRLRHDNAYFRLKMVLDYWCALWFWEYDETLALPTRREYWSDIEAMLDVSDQEMDANTTNALMEVSGKPVAIQGTLDFEAGEGAYFAREEAPIIYDAETSETIHRSKEQVLAKKKGSERSFFDESERFAITKKYADRYHFFHPMLEFLEVFWLRDGFDIICGNPPFLKWLFEPQQVLSEKYPELVIRPDVFDADFVESHKSDYLTTDSIKSIYHAEQTECFCCQSLLNTPTLYGVLKGGQTDLFKCILVNSLSMLSPKGYMGLIHPDTVFTEAKGQLLREYLYPRLDARYHYSNKLKLFSEVHGEKIFDCCIYRGFVSSIHFDSISNLYHPNTVDASYSYSGNGICLGLEYVDNDGKKHTNTAGHRDRIIHYDEDLLKVVGKVFENTEEWQSCKLISMHAMSSLNIIKSFMNFQHVSSVNPFMTVAFDATNALKNGTMKQETKYPDYDAYQMIFNSTQVGILSPFSKLPQKICTRDVNYDVVDYTRLPIDYDIRTNYVPKIDVDSFKSCIDETGNWFKRYKVGFKKMMDPTHERTLKGGILPPKASHTHSMLSLSFQSDDDMIQFVGLSASVLFDFFIKTVGVRNFMPSIAGGLPFGIDDKFKNSIRTRVLRMNCVNHWYKNLWEKNYRESFKTDLWSKTDKRLSSFSGVSNVFDENVLLKNEFERRQALVELDVLAAMALGFTLNDLIFVYINTFSTTQKYEADTWYDANGRVVFSVSSEYDLKLPRTGNRRQGTSGWEDIRGDKIDDNTYAGISPIFTQTIDPSKSEIYGGQEQTFVAPYTRCDRIADYHTAWAHFEKLFNIK